MAARDPIPEFDLYEELEVSPKASQPTIEAAYRSLLKRHHPDVAGGDAAVLERSKRINVAHDWLTDPARRAEYDRARGAGTSAGTGAGGTPGRTTPGGGADPGAARNAGAAGADGAGAGPSGAEGPRTGPTAGPAHQGTGTASRPGKPASPFGPNAATYRAFLGDVRGVTHDRASRIAGRAAAAGRAASGPGSYMAAVLAVAAASPQRQEACVEARAAVRTALTERLPGSPDLEPAVDVAANLACAIAVRDLIPKADYEAIRGVWTGAGHGRARTVRDRAARRPAPEPQAWAPANETVASLIEDIGSVDLARARRVTDAYRRAGPSGRDGARARAISVASRRDAWRTARRQADTVARQRVLRLEGHVSAEVFAWAAADAAGAVALRAEIAPADFSLLFAPWALGRTQPHAAWRMPVWAWGVVGVVGFLLLVAAAAILGPGPGF